MKSKIVLATLVACLVPVSSLAGTSKINQKKIDTVKLMHSQAGSSVKGNEFGVSDIDLLYMYGSKGLKKSLLKYKQYNDPYDHPSCNEIYPSLHFTSEMRDDFVKERIAKYQVLKNGKVRVTTIKTTTSGKNVKLFNDFSLSCTSSGQCQITDVSENGYGSLRKDINQSCNANTI